MRVLIVDDNEILSALMKEILETEGICHVQTAWNGEDGYATFLNFQPDIILTDIEMPIKNGLEMVKNIRTHTPMIKTIYMSSNPMKYLPFLEQEQDKYSAYYLTKPFSLSQMIGLLEEYQYEQRPQIMKEALS